MKFHEAGRVSIFITLFTVVMLTVCYVLFLANLWWVNLIFFTVMLVTAGMVVRFFRVPFRIINKVEDGVLAPADGTILSVGPAFEYEYFKDERIKISIFMSVHNVHVNSYPTDGTIEYIAYHPGKYVLAKLPKSSVDNEHNTIVVSQDEHRPECRIRGPPYHQLARSGRHRPTGRRGGYDQVRLPRGRVPAP